MKFFLKVASLCIVLLVCNYMQTGLGLGLGNINGQGEGWVLGWFENDAGSVRTGRKDHSGHNEDDDFCDSVHCKSPPSDADCDVVGRHEIYFARPSGKRPKCCPLYNCSDSSGEFPFNGVLGRGPQKPGSSSRPDDTLDGGSINLSSLIRDKCTVTCQSPPMVDEGVTCGIVPPWETNVTRPQGKKVDCCPLHKCEFGDGSYYLFHGVYGKGPTKKGKKVSPCVGLECMAPPKTSFCALMDEEDTTFEKPTGKKALCCPVYKCLDTTREYYFPFHGAYGPGPKKKAPTVAVKRIVRLTTTTPKPSSLTTTTPKHKVSSTTTRKPKSSLMDMSMDFGMGIGGMNLAQLKASAAKIKEPEKEGTTTPSPVVSSTATPSPVESSTTNPSPVESSTTTEEIPASSTQAPGNGTASLADLGMKMDFGMGGGMSLGSFKDIKEPSFDFEMPPINISIPTNQTPSEVVVGPSGNVTTYKIQDQEGVSSGVTSISQGGQDAVAVASDGSGNDADTAKQMADMEKEMAAMQAEMNMNFM